MVEFIFAGVQNTESESRRVSQREILFMT